MGVLDCLIESIKGFYEEPTKIKAQFYTRGLGTGVYIFFEKHVQSIYIATIPMPESNVHPTNIRSWKRIMPQSNPNGVVDTPDLENKKKASTCMAPTIDFPCKRLQVLDDEVSLELMVEAAV